MRQTETWHWLFFALALTLGVLLNLIALAAAQAVTYQNTTRTGNTGPNEIWQGTIDVTGDITVATGSTLTIEPGTMVRFAAGSDDQHNGPTSPITDPYFPHDPAIAPSTICSINVYGGSLYAIGTSTNPIVFTSSAAHPNPGDWQSIQYILPGSILRLQYSLIEYGYYGVQINTAATDANITINNNTMCDLVACAVCPAFNGSKISITVSDNDIFRIGHEGVATDQFSNMVIENNFFHDIYNHIDGPSGAGVVIAGNSSTVRYNKFEKNRFGLNIISQSNPSIYGNFFTANYANCYGYCPPIPASPGAPRALLPLLLTE